jgi:hypothetical protein
MIDQKTATGVCDSLAHVSGPRGEGEGAVRSSSTSGEGRIENLAMCAGGTAAAIVIDAALDDEGRRPDDDWRVAIHEGSHCLSGLVLFGPDSLGGSTVLPTATYGGLTWGPKGNSAELGSTEDVPVDLCDQMRALMPADGEPILNASEIHAHVRGRCVDLLSGSEGERLLCPDGPPWPADSDLAQARSLASIVCSSTESVELFLAFCRAEAANLVAKHRASIQAVAAALIEHRSLTGDQIVAVVAESVAREAMAAEHARRAAWRRAEESAASFVAFQAP